MEIELFILGALLSWLTSHIYYKLSNKDQDAIYAKLTQDVRTIILEDERASLSVEELNELLVQRTIDSSIAAHDPLRFKACPVCGSTELDFNYMYDPRQVEYLGDVSCTKCNWTESGFTNKALFTEEVKKRYRKFTGAG